MKLQNVKIAGFRRFEDLTSIQLGGKLVALTGPNEAGKTSALRALHHFGNENEIQAHEKTTFFSGETYVEISYFLEPEDLEIAALDRPTWLHYRKKEDGGFTYRFQPQPERKLTLRQKVKSSLQKLLRSKSSRRRFADSGYAVDDDQLQEILELCESTVEFSSEELDELREFNSQVPDISEETSAPAYLRSLNSDIDELTSFEASHFPRKEAFNALKNRMPNFLFFTDSDRKIELPYDIRLYRHPTPQSRKSPSRPLLEIIKMSGLELDALISEQAAGNTAGTNSLIIAANEKLREVSKGVWNQSDACLYFDLDGPNLDLFVENREGFEPRNRLSNLSSRSDGYRQFVALFIFTFLSKKTNSVVLIDEIEQHLHYDAQADLVQHLQSDPSISKVIYTTHSAGALPEDLGSGIRLIKWSEENPKKSLAINKFWKDGDGSAFRPLLFGMGATTFAFFPTRKALVTEGPTELLLLPRMLREAIEAESLGFQVVHGLSQYDLEHLTVVGADLSAVCYLTDNDKGGGDLRKNLGRAGVPSNRIFHVGRAGRYSTLEDLLDANVWRESVNQYIGMYGEARGITERISRVPARNRINSLPESIRGEKISFAYNILEMVADDPNTRILSAGAKTGLRRIAERIKVELEVNNTA